MLDILESNLAFVNPITVPRFRSSNKSKEPITRGNLSCRSHQFIAALASSEHPEQMVTPCPPTKLRAIFFDLDGTCVNSDHLHFETYRDTLLDLVPSFNNGEPITRLKYDTEMSGRQNPELVASVLPKMPETERTKLWQTKEARYESIIMRGVPPICGLLGLLDKCRDTGIINWVVTNAPKGSCHKTMKSIGISPYFKDEQKNGRETWRVVVAEECKRPKPNPDPYLRALELADVSSSEVIVFEDSPSGTIAATAAGIYTIGIRSTQTDATLREAGAGFTISDYEDEALITFLKQYNTYSA